MYRLLRKRGQSRQRRAQATHPPKTKPELVAHAPNQVWSYDITKLAWTRPGQVLRSVRHDRHLLPVCGALGNPHQRIRRDRRRIHRQLHRSQFPNFCPCSESPNRTPGRRPVTTTPTAKHISRRSSTSRRFLIGSVPSREPGGSAADSSSITTTSTTTPGSGCTLLSGAYRHRARDSGQTSANY